MPFDEKVRIKILLWCDRHCCLCKKACGVNIEVHHIIPSSKSGSDDLENAIPLCFDCHSEVERYNAEHSKGTKYKKEELIARREQVYDEYTRHLVPPIEYRITQELGGGKKRTFPDVGFKIGNVGDHLPARVLVNIGSVMDDTVIPVLKNARACQKKWNLNPRTVFSGHFQVSEQLIPKRKSLELRVTLTIIDQFDREHKYLPTSFIYEKDGSYWYAEP